MEKDNYKESCKTTGEDVLDHFVDVTKMVKSDPELRENRIVGFLAKVG
jgi:hypothetical protein